jgi:GNAT superfamily N-acetyltransferase
MTVTYRLLDRSAALSHHRAITELYAVVYAEEPYSEGPEQVAEFAARFPAETRRPGFALAAALTGDALVGAAYGWTMAAGAWWAQSDAPPPPEVRAVDKLAVLEWLVHPDDRGRGIGSALMALLLDGRPERWATLAADPRSKARRMYARAGWRQVARSRLPWGPMMDLLVLPLPQQPERFG